MFTWKATTTGADPPTIGCLRAGYVLRDRAQCGSQGIGNQPWADIPGFQVAGGIDDGAFRDTF
jgi:hypothetical protein